MCVCVWLMPALLMSWIVEELMTAVLMILRDGGFNARFPGGLG